MIYYTPVDVYLIKGELLNEHDLERTEIKDERKATYKIKKLKIHSIMDVQEQETKEIEVNENVLKPGDILEGPLFCYLDKDRCKMECVDMFQYTGKYEYYHENGAIYFQCHYLNGCRNGTYREYSKEGKFLLYCELQNDQFHGKYIEYYETPNSVSIHAEYQNNLLNGKYEMFGKNGDLLYSAMYHDNELEGKMFEVLDDGNKVKSMYKKNKLNGVYEEFNPNGELILSIEYVDGKKHGKYFEYTDDVLITSSYVEDELHGLYQEKTLDCKILVECNYKNGKLHGELIEYDETEKVVVLEKYVDGEQIMHNEKSDSSCILS